MSPKTAEPKRRGRPPRTAPRPEVEAAIEDLTGGAKAPAGANGKTKPRAGETAIELPELKIQTMRITLIGDSSLICHAWSHKAKSQMLAKQMKQAKQGKEAKNPEQDFKDSLYPHPDGGYGFPAVAFKSAAVDACSHVQGVTKVEARGAFHINGELIRIDGEEPTPREDMVRIAMGTADIRYRGEFKQWRCTIELRYNINVLSPAQIVNLFNTAGFAIGIGEWRPQKDGSHGMFHVQREGED